MNKIFCSGLVAVWCLFAVVQHADAGGKIGIWKDGRSHITDGMLKTLHEAGWETVILEKTRRDGVHVNDLADDELLDTLDVVFLPAGWNAYWFADFNARRALVRFTAGGKGLLAGAFRSGWVRTANRPIFPEVGATYNRVNSPLVEGYGDSVLAKAIDKPFAPGGWDHLVVDVGPQGKIFAVSGGDPVGVYGDVYGGRYLVFGGFIGLDAKTEAMTGTPRSAFLAMLDWLNSAPKLSDAEKAKYQAQADIDFLRREMLYDWTNNTRGPDRDPGILATIHGKLAIPLESRLYTLQFMSNYLSGKELKECSKTSADLEKAVETLNTRYAGEIARIEAKVAKMGLKELLAENPFVQGTNLAAKVEAAPDRTEDEKKATLGVLPRSVSTSPPTYASRELAMFLHGKALSGKLFPEQELKKLVDIADKTITALKPKVEAGRLAVAQVERKKDIAAVPGLIEACSSDDVEVRRAAVVELGRIGDKRSGATLVKLLGDPDEEVRISAVLALGWMQDKAAVPELIKLASGDNIRLRRRAAQALGQIGDARAVPALVANISNPDFHVAENSIFSLGWLKAKTVVPTFVKMISAREIRTDDFNTRRQRTLAVAAVRALGYIGDASALPALEKLVEEADDFPISRRGNKRIANIYSTAQPLGLQGHAELAIEKIKSNAHPEPGLKQAGFLSLKDSFYGLTGRFNALAGRTDIYRSLLFKDNPSSLWPILWEAGFTGIHQAWGEQDSDPDKYFNLVQTAGDFGFRWVEVMPVGHNWFGGKTLPPRYGPLSLDKAGADVVLNRHANLPALQGFWSEESYPDAKLTAEEFETWLVEKYGQDFRKKLGLKKDDELLAMEGKAYTEYEGPLKNEYMLCCADKLIEFWRESQEWLSGARKGCGFTFSVTTVETVKYPGLTGGIGSVIDVNGPESYQSFGRYNTFFMEMYKDGQARPVMCEFYNWYSPSPAHDVRGFAQHLMHGECYYNFVLTHICKYPAYDLWSWDDTRWDNARRIFRKARDISEYIAVPESAANVALVCSELSYAPFYDVHLHGTHNALLNRWYQNQAGLWTALNQAQIPTDIIWTETLTPEKLKRYKVLVLSDAKIVTDEQAGILSDWVENGGVLITSGTTSLFDPWAKQQKNYAVADLLGVDYAGYAGVDDPDNIDTFCWMSGGNSKTKFKVVSGLVASNFFTHVHRDQKPSKSLGVYTVSDDAKGALPGIAADTAVEYDLPLGYDKVKPGAAQVLATFANGDPAVTLNKAGSGMVYFWTPIYPGLCYVSSGWEMYPHRLDFWPNVTELLSAMVRGGLEQQGATLPVELSNVSKEIEVTVRSQPEHNRWMVHLLNYDTSLDLVKNPEITVYPPENVSVKKVYYPDTDTELKFESTEKGIAVKLRDFDVHDMVVVEWEKYGKKLRR